MDGASAAELTPLTAAMKIFSSSTYNERLEIRPGRNIQVLRLTAAQYRASFTEEVGKNSEEPEEDKDTSTAIFFYHGSMATMTDYGLLMRSLCFGATSQTELEKPETTGEAQEGSKEEGKQGATEEILLHTDKEGEMALPDDVLLVSYDALGCGMSAKPEGHAAYSTEELYEDALAVFRRFKCKKNLLVGHSFGSSLVLRLAAALDAKQEGILGVILIGTTLGGSSRNVMRQLLFSLPVFVLRWLQDGLTRQFLAAGVHPSASEELKSWVTEKCNANDMAVCKAFYRQLKWIDITMLSTIGTEVLIIQGDEDQLTPLPGAQALNEELKKVTVSTLAEVKEAGHMVQLEKPDDVAQIIKKFFFRKN